MWYEEVSGGELFHHRITFDGVTNDGASTLKPPPRGGKYEMDMLNESHKSDKERYGVWSVQMGINRVYGV